MAPHTAMMPAPSSAWPERKYSVAHTALTSSVWPTSGSEMSSPVKQAATAMASGSAGMSRRLSLSANSQAETTTKPGLANSDGWIVWPAIDSQRRAPLISGPKKWTRDHADEGDGEQREREAAHAARREQRHRQHDQHADGGEEQVALDEVVGRQAFADGDGRARRQRQDQSRADEGEDGADQHVIDGEPPVGDTAAVGARQPHAAPRFMSMPGNAATSARKASPRTSKLRNWSNEAQAGDNSTTGSRAPAAAASRAAAAVAASSVPQRSNTTLPSSVAANSSVASPIR